jgi:hypothetical protein
VQAHPVLVIWPGTFRRGRGQAAEAFNGRAAVKDCDRELVAEESNGQLDPAKAVAELSDLESTTERTDRRARAKEAAVRKDQG